jgi:hypothetical protein
VQRVAQPRRHRREAAVGLQQQLPYVELHVQLRLCRVTSRANVR